jgi:peptidoglycan hydrolase-like protein with peptidoglycan-binding domain
MRGEDVRELQVFLNSDTSTRIAQSGIGSSGYESTYYGARTAQAVSRFQAKYASEVLAPAGLLYPTGIVGALTRQKISQLRSSTTPTSLPSVVEPVSVPSPIVTAPRIDAVTPSIVTSDNQIITLKGSFSTSGNIVVLSSESKDGMYATTSADGSTISFPFSFSLARKLKQQLNGISTNRASVVVSIVSNLSGPEIEQQNGTAYSRVILIVRNSYGESIPRTLYVDLASVLNS